MSLISSLTLNLPSGVSNNDVIASVIFADQTITLPSGWTQISGLSGSGGGINFITATHTATNSEINSHASWTWSFAAPANTGYQMYDFGNVTGIGNVAIQGFSTPTTSIAAPSISATSNETCFVVWAVLADTGLTLPTPPGAVEGGIFAAGAITHAAFAYTAPGGATGTQTATAGAASTGLAGQVNLHGSGAHIISCAGGSSR